MEERSPERESGERGTPKPTAILSRAPQGVSRFPVLTVEGVGPAQQLLVGLENQPSLPGFIPAFSSRERVTYPWAGSLLETRKSPPEPLWGQHWCKVHKCSSRTGLSESLGMAQGHLPASLLLPLTPKSLGTAQGPSMFTHSS